MQEYWPALLPLVLGLSAFAVGMIFASRERSSLDSRRLPDLEREQIHHHPRQTG